VAKRSGTEGKQLTAQSSQLGTSRALVSKVQAGRLTPWVQLIAEGVLLP